MKIASIRRAIDYATDTLTSRKEEVNRLNVFPVPDGDTGTNMSLTMQSVAKELALLPPSATSDDVRRAITHGSLMGARGNSGVITSQILRGLCEGFEGATTCDAATISRALDRSVEVAFQAVRKPVKGTILTVLEDAAAAARMAADEGLSPVATLEAISEEALASVKRTSDFLPVLKENGVVDSGGFGLTILFQAFAASLSGKGDEAIAHSEDFTHAQAQVAIEQVNDWAGSDYMYCTEFLFHSVDIDTDAALAFLADAGDCELLVGSHPDFKVHVHTDTPGEVLNYMTARGQVSEVFIHNMVLESAERAEGLADDEDAAAGSGEAGAGTGAGASQAPSEHKELAFVAVAVGSGTAAILRSLGVDYVVEGGQTMNPSTADLLAAVEAANADAVVIMPDNGNIIMAANAAAENAPVPCAVVPTKNVLAAFSAMFAADRGAGLEENARAMTEALDSVHCAEVTTAVKSSKTSKGEKIAPGDVIGIADGSLDVAGTSVAEVVMALAEQMEAGDFDTLTLLAGADLPDEALEELTEAIEQAWPDLDVDAQRGEQPLYPVLFSLE